MRKQTFAGAFLMALAGMMASAAPVSIQYEVAARISKDRVPASRPTFYEQEIEKRFGIKLHYQDIPDKEYSQKVMVLILAGEKIDFFQLGGPIVGKQLGDEGYLKSIDSFISKLPNYRALFSDEDWEEAYEKRAGSDGKAYVLPFPFPGTGDYVHTGWVYKKSAWDALGLSLPKNVEELARQLEVIKAKYPDSIGLATRHKTLAGDFSEAFRTFSSWYVDYDLTPKGDKITFGPSTTKYRDMLTFVNGLYTKGLVDPEFPTTNDQKWSEKFARGVGYVDNDFPTRASWAEGLEKAKNTNAVWESMPIFLGSEKYGNKPIVSSASDSKYAESDGMIPKHLSGEKEARLLKFLDWTVTEEGKLFTQYGVEGLTYQFLDGVPRLFTYNYTDAKGKITTAKQKITDPLTGQVVDFGWKLGFPPGSPDFTGPLLIHPLNARETFDSVALNKIVKSGGADLYREYSWNVQWKFSPEEEKQRKDLETVLSDISDSYTVQFVLGQLDPKNDAHWFQFQQALKKAKLDDAAALRDLVMARVKSNLKKPRY